MTSVDVEEVTEDLYGLPPEEFTAARDEAAKQAVDSDLRKAIKALRKPTAAAHEVNRLVRERTNDIDSLLALGDEMRAAMGGDAGEVRRLTGVRRDLIADLVSPDLPPATQQDVTATLEAATADPELAAAVRSGRLVKPLRYAGFGTMPDLGDVLATPLSKRAPAHPTTVKKSAAPKPVKAATPAKPAKAAKSAVTEPPEPDLTAARDRVLELSGLADDAQRRYEQAVKRATEARQLLDELEAERADAHKAARAAHAEAEKARRDLGRLERK